MLRMQEVIGGDTMRKKKFNVFTVGKHRKRSRVNYYNTKHTAFAFYRANTYVKPEMMLPYGR